MYRQVEDGNDDDLIEHPNMAAEPIVLMDDPDDLYEDKN